MEKSKTSIVVKTVLFVTIALCAVYGIMGLVSLCSFLQMVTFEIGIQGYGYMIKSDLAEEFTIVTILAIVCTGIALILLALNLLHLKSFSNKDENTIKRNKLLFPLCASSFQLPP